mgnify:CR=1 FL=1
MELKKREPGYVIMVDKEHRPVVLENGKVYTSLSNDVFERAKHLNYHFESYKSGKAVIGEDFRCSTEIKQAIQAHGGELYAVPVKTFSYGDAKRFASRLNNPYRLAVA